MSTHDVTDRKETRRSAGQARRLDVPGASAGGGRAIDGTASSPTECSSGRARWTTSAASPESGITTARGLREGDDHHYTVNTQFAQMGGSGSGVPFSTDKEPP